MTNLREITKSNTNATLAQQTIYSQQEQLTANRRNKQQTNVTCDFRREAENGSHEKAPLEARGERGCRGVAHAQYRFRWGWP